MLGNKKITSLVLCAGNGTRLYPITKRMAKPMVDINGHPAVYYVIKNLEENGINKLIFNIHYKPESILPFINRKGKIFFEPELLGTAGAIRNVARELSDPFVVVNGDTLSHINIRDMLQFHSHNGFIATIFTRVDAIHSGGTYIMSKEILQFIPEDKTPYSIHEDLIPNLIQKMPERIGLYQSEEKYLDIGTPSGFMRALREWKEKL